MRVLGPLSTLLLPLILLSGAPALSGCDSTTTGTQCTETIPFSTEDLTPEGTELGAAVEANACVSISYIGRLEDGSGVFDEGTLNVVFTNQQSEDFFTAGNLIPGFVLGLAGQQVNETRRVVIPPSLGYGTRAIEGRNGGVGIPSCSTH